VSINSAVEVDGATVPFEVDTGSAVIIILQYAKPIVNDLVTLETPKLVIYKFCRNVQDVAVNINIIIVNVTCVVKIHYIINYCF